MESQLEKDRLNNPTIYQIREFDPVMEFKTRILVVTLNINDTESPRPSQKKFETLQTKGVLGK